MGGGNRLIVNNLIPFNDFPYFVLGTYIHIFSFHDTILRNDKVQAFLLVTAAAMFFNIYYLGGHGTTLLMFSATMSMFGLIIRANPAHPFVRFLSRIGKMSLDIYVLHFFFLLTFWQPAYFPKGAIGCLPFLLQLALLVGMSLLLIAGSWLVSKAIRLNKLLSFLVFGRK